MPGQKETKDVDIVVEKGAVGGLNLAKCRFVDSMLERAKKSDAGGESREDTFKRMDVLQKYYDDGGMHKFKNMAKHRARSVANKCFALVEGALPIVTKYRAKAEFLPGAGEDVDIVNQLRTVYEAKLDDLDVDMKTTLSTKSALIRTEGYLKVFWNPLLMGGLGDVDVQIVDPKRMYFIGGSDPLLKDAFCVIYHGPHTIGELQAWYPEKVSALRTEWARIGGSVDIEHMDVPDSYGSHQAVSDDGTGAVMKYDSATGEGFDGSEQMMLTELWIDDKTLVKKVVDWIVIVADGEGDEGTQFKVVGEATPENEQAISQQNYEYDVINGMNLSKIGLTNRLKMLRKYPFGRIIAKTGDTLLRDGASKYTHGRCPYVRYYVCPVPGKNYFYGEIDQVITLQDTLNKRDSQITDILSLTANPPMLVNIASGIKPKKMTNEAGLIIPVNTKPQDAAMWLHTPNIPSALFADVQRIGDDFDSVSGYHDITAGRKPAGITAGVAIESLQEAAQTRYSQKAYYIEHSSKHLAELMVSVIWEFYREPRSVRTADKDNPGNYKFENVDFGSAKLVGGLPDIRIKSGSTMSVNESIRRSQALQLFQMISSVTPGGALAFLKTVLQKFDWEDVEGTYKAIIDAAQGEQQGMPQ